MRDSPKKNKIVWRSLAYLRYAYQRLSSWNVNLGSNARHKQVLCMRAYYEVCTDCVIALRVAIRKPPVIHGRHPLKQSLLVVYNAFSPV